MKNIILYLLTFVMLCTSACKSESLNKTKDDNSNANIHLESQANTNASFDANKTANSITFKLNDLDGNEFSSADILKKHKLTLINFWGTNCGYCIIEMPDLEELNKDLNPSDFGIIGIITDGDYNTSDAREIIKETGVTYPNICMNAELYNMLQIQVVPTTYIVDSSGKVIGNPIYGARSKDEYRKELENRLNTIS